MIYMDGIETVLFVLCILLASDIVVVNFTGFFECMLYIYMLLRSLALRCGQLQ